MRSVLRRSAALLAAALILAACGFGSAPDTPAVTDAPAPDGTSAPAAPNNAAQPDATAESGEVVTIGFGAQSFERQTYEPLIEQFNQQNPAIRVQFVSLDEIMQPQQGQEFDPDQMQRKVVSAADTAMSYFLRPDDIAKGYVSNLKPLMDSDTAFDSADFYPGLIEQYTRDGGVYMLPQSTRVSLLSYNKDLWARKGLPAPKPDWTSRDMIAAAQQIATKKGDKVEIYGLVDWSGEYTALFGELDAAGVNLFGPDADKIRLDRPEIAAALTRVRELADSGAIYVQQLGSNGVVSSDDFQKLIEGGQAGMWQRLFNGPSDKKPAFAVGTLAYPNVPGPFSFGNTQGYIMSAGTQHPQEAWRWLAFLSKQALKRPFAGPDDVSELPARKSVAEQSGYWKQLDDETRAAVEAIVARPPKPTPGLPDSKVFQALNEALGAVTSGAKKPDQALRDAQAKLEDLRAQAQSTPQPSAAAGPIVVATPQAAAQAAPGATTITFAAPPGFGGTDGVRKIADAFNQQHPDIFVQVKDIAFGSGPVSMPQVAIDNDCFSWWGPPQQGEITATLDLQPLIDADPTFKRDDYPAALLAPFRHESGLYGLPTTVSFRTLSYNQTAFDAAGIAHPTADWTIDNLLDAAQKLTKGAEKDRQYGFVSLGGQTGDLLFFVNRLAGGATTGGGDSERPNFTDPKVVQAVRAYLDLLRSASPHKEIQGYKRGSWSDDAFQITTEGKAGMWLNYGLDNISEMRGPNAGFTVAIAPPPLAGSQLKRDDFNESGLFISAKTQHADACWTWLEALSEDAAIARGGFPARISVAESDAFLKSAPPGAAEVYKAYRAALDRSADTASGGSSFDIESPVDLYWFFRAADRALQGKDLQRELTDAQTITEQFATCVRGGLKPAACAKQVDPQYEGWRSEEPPR